MKLPLHIKGLIFDCDGTLADTMPLHWHAWQIVTQRHGLHFPEDRFYSFGGVPTRDILKMLAQEQGRSLDHIAVAHEKEEAYLPLMSRISRDQGTTVFDSCHNIVSLILSDASLSSKLGRCTKALLACSEDR